MGEPTAPQAFVCQRHGCQHARLEQEVADLRAQLATNATTIDRLSDANRVLAKECDQARAKLEEAEETIEQRQCIGCPSYTRAADLWVALLEREKARVRRLEEALLSLVNLCHQPNPDDLSRWDVGPGNHRAFSAWVASASAALTPVKAPDA